MTTLHALRRAYHLSLSELAYQTGVPARRLAEYEYEEHPLSPAEQQALAAFFGTRPQLIRGGLELALPRPAGSLVQPEQAYLLAALAATAALSWSLNVLAPRLPSLPSSRSGAAVAPAPAEPIPASTPAGPGKNGPLAAPLGLALDPDATARPVEASPTASDPATLPPLTPSLVPSATETALPGATPSLTATPEPAHPYRCPVVSDQGQIVVTRGYSGGSHSPTSLNGALDLAVDGDGNGYAEPGATRGAIIVAAHAGVVTVSYNTWPAGNHIWLDGADGWRSGYSHLQEISVKTGDRVVGGQPIGVVGNTGFAAGPHLEIQVWQDGKNVDPSDMLECG